MMFASTCCTAFTPSMPGALLQPRTATSPIGRAPRSPCSLSSRCAAARLYESESRRRWRPLCLHARARARRSVGAPCCMSLRLPARVNPRVSTSDNARRLRRWGARECGGLKMVQTPLNPASSQNTNENFCDLSTADGIWYLEQVRPTGVLRRARACMEIAWGLEFGLRFCLGFSLGRLTVVALLTRSGICSAQILTAKVYDVCIETALHEMSRLSERVGSSILVCV